MFLNKISTKFASKVCKTHFKRNNIMKSIKTIIFLASIFICTLTSCSGNDETSAKDCESGTIANQDAKGVFKGKSFTYKAAYYKKFVDDSYSFTIHVEDLAGNCSSVSKNSILFRLDSLQPQSITLSLKNNVNFNTTITNEVNAEIATCGKIEVISVTSGGTVSGRIVAEGADGSTINGNFTAELCD